MAGSGIGIAETATGGDFVLAKPLSMDGLVWLNDKHIRDDAGLRMLFALAGRPKVLIAISPKAWKRVVHEIHWHALGMERDGLIVINGTRLGLTGKAFWSVVGHEIIHFYLRKFEPMVWEKVIVLGEKGRQDEKGFGGSENLPSHVFDEIRKRRNQLSPESRERLDALMEYFLTEYNEGAIGNKQGAASEFFAWMWNELYPGWKEGVKPFEGRDSRNSPRDGSRAGGMMHGFIAGLSEEEQRIINGLLKYYLLPLQVVGGTVKFSPFGKVAGSPVAPRERRSASSPLLWFNPMIGETPKEKFLRIVKSLKWLWIALFWATIIYLMSDAKAAVLPIWFAMTGVSSPADQAKGASPAVSEIASSPNRSAAPRNDRFAASPTSTGVEKTVVSLDRKSAIDEILRGIVLNSENPFMPYLVPMISAMMDLVCQIKGRVVVIEGVGTGLLAAVAERLGAEKVVGIDMDNGELLKAEEMLIRNGVTAKIGSIEAPAIDPGVKVALLHGNLEQWYGLSLIQMRRIIGTDPVLRVVSLGPFYDGITLEALKFAPEMGTVIFGGYVDFGGMPMGFGPTHDSGFLKSR